MQNLINRLSQTSEKIDNSIAIRGYDRIINHPEYLLFGAGAHHRFSVLGLELHSSLGTIQFSYGIIGTVLFIAILFVSLYMNKFQYWYIILCILVYGFSHNGLRNSMFWILVAVLSIGFSSTENKNEIIH